MNSANSSSWLTSAAVLTLGFIATPISAQITPDATLPNNSVVLPNGNVMTIEGGTIARSNLFHSFQEFSIPTGGEAYFNNALTIDNIITRVTGGNLSDIDGLIRANSTANLFLINPNGIQFGPNASLDIGGSFLGSTAESLLFEDGSFYSATEPNASPLLSINVPIGLQMGMNPGAIRATGTGQNIFTNTDPRFDPLFFLPLIRLPNPANLEVASGRTLALVGGNITLQGSALRANEGRIELGGVSSGVVGLERHQEGWMLDYAGVWLDRDVTLELESALDTGGLTSQGIQLVGRQIRLRDGSVAVMQVSGHAPDARLTVTATELVEVMGIQPISLVASAIGIGNLGSGEVGDLTIDSRDLTVARGGQIGLVQLGSNSGSRINLNISNSTLISGTSPKNPSRFSRLGAINLGSGDGGDLSVSTGTLTLENGGNLGSIAVLNRGSGGDVTINATESIDISGETLNRPSSINTSTLGRGNAGRISIDTGRLRITDRGTIESSTISTGNAGELSIRASESIEVTSGVRESVIGSRALENKDFQIALGLPDAISGNAGQVTIETPRFSARGNLSSIAVGNIGSGNAGDLEIDAGSIVLDRDSQISAATASGEGGNIRLQASESLVLRNGGEITATARGTGNGGSLSLDTPLLVAVPRENSDIIANAFEGNGGNIEIDAIGIFGLENRPQLTSESDITASSQFGVDGTVAVNNPVVDPVSGLTLDSDTLNPNTQIQDSCDIATRSRFAMTGNGGLPPDPTDFFRGQTVWRDTRLGEIDSNLSPNPTESESETTSTSLAPLIEATGWRTNDEGQVELVVASGNPSQSPWQPHPECNSATQTTPHPGSFEQK